METVIPKGSQVLSDAVVDELCVSAEYLAAAYDDLLLAYGKPFDWGYLNSERVRVAVKRIKGD